MQTMKRLLAIALALTMVFALAACGGNSGAADSTVAGSTPAQAAAVTENAVYRTLYASEVTTLNYLITGQTNELTIAANVVDCLVEYDSCGNVEPALATSWEQNEDATVWTFHIREGVNWVDKDGNVVAPVTANDWVSSARYASDANNSSAVFYAIDDVVVGADAYYDWTAYQMALPTATDGTDEAGNAVKFITNEDGEQEVLEEVPEASAEDIGVKALDDYTLEFTLESPRPYFLSMVSFGPYMPVYGPFLEECGSKFGTDNSTLLYCGAFILSTYQPQQQRVLTKNPTYWDKDNVFLDAIQMTYNAEASSIAVSMYQSGEVDQADISSDLLSAMMADDSTKNLIHPTRADTSYAYWYLFNFDPNFDAEFEPENWKLAVNNENFRKSIVHAFNRMPALATNDRIDPESLKNNTITPNAFASASKDYTYYEGLAAYTDGDNFDEALAEEYKTKAFEELTAAGVTFPIKIQYPYNPAVVDWDKQCQVFKQQVEGVLNDGFDFISIIITQGPSDNFLNAVRRVGAYELMSYYWGADYSDPETEVYPFYQEAGDRGTCYSFLRTGVEDGIVTGETADLVMQYMSMVENAKTITEDLDARYEAFADAEAFLIENALVIPLGMPVPPYIATRLNLWEGQYAPTGLSTNRLKGVHILDHYVSMDEYNSNRDAR